MPLDAAIARQLVRPLERMTARQPAIIVSASMAERASESVLQRHERDASAAVIRLLRAHPKLTALYNQAYSWLSKPRHDTAHLGNVGRLDAKVTRMGQPTAEGFKTLAREGYTSVINLRAEESWEKPWAEAAGLRYTQIPLPGEGRPSLAQGTRFLELATDPAMGRVAFHCQRGADRTGAMAAIYRMAAQQWPVDAAIAEMPRYHFAAGFEDANRDFVRAFAAHWQSLDAPERARILHQAPAASGFTARG